MNSAHNAAALHWFVTNTADISSFGEGPARLLGLIRAHAKRTGRAWPACATMARELAVSRSTIHRWLSQLRRAGAVDVRRTGRGSVYVPIAAGAEAAPLRHQMSQSDTSEPAAIDMVRKAQEQVVVTAPPPAETAPATGLTTPSLLEEETEQPPDRSALADLRDQLATATEREAEWRETAPEAPERRQAAELRRYLSARLAWHEDVRRVAEAVQDLPGWRGWRGHGGVRNIEDLWRIRAEQARMPSDTWRRSCLRWCAHHTRHRGHLGDLRGWLLRERYEETEPPPRIPPDLPPPPPATAATETEYTLWRCADPSAPSCSFWRAGTEAGEEPPRCPHCGTPGVAT